MNRKLLSIAHSYVANVNRRLAHEMARAGAGRWEVTAVAPSYFHGGNDLRPITFEAMPDEPCRVEAVPARLTRKVHLFTYSRRLKRLMREGWDFVHCWEEPYILAGGQIAWWTPKRTPMAFATFQNNFKRYPPPFSSVEKYVFARADGAISFARTVTEVLVDRGFAKPYREIPPGVDVERFVPSEAQRSDVHRELNWATDGPPVVGYLGRFTEAKGMRVLMGALDAVRSPWRLLLVGAGEMESELRAWAGRHGDRVRLCTNVRHDQVPRYLNAMDMLCAPSQTTPSWREQFGRMLIEAFACGVPVIGSDSGEIPFVIGEAGVVVGEKDVAGWTSAIEALLNDPARRAELAAMGLERAQQFAWPVIARAYLSFFDELLERRAKHV